MTSGNGHFRFGEFGLDIGQRLLIKNGRELSLTPKAMALLIVLLEKRGQIVEKTELIEKVWTDAIVEDGNLAYTIRLLRKTLGDDPDSPKYIQTIPRRGYRFVAECHTDSEKPLKIERAFSDGIYGKGLAKVVGSGLIGREKEIAEIIQLLENDKVGILTLTGPGGTGKTRLANEIDLRFRQQLDGQVIFVDLTAVTDPLLVPEAIVHELDIREFGTNQTLDVLSEHFRERAALLILDNFEQVASAAVQLVHLIHRAPQLKILVTSREPLKISIETEYRVPPLAVPTPESKENIYDLMQFGSVQLFIQRARSARQDLELSDEDANALSGICARLDGIPLALELAASRAKVLSIREIYSKLQNRLALLTGGSVDKPNRQRTMRATIEWSYELLSELEKQVFALLSVFEGGFTFNAAERVLTDFKRDELQFSDTVIVDAITSLNEKGLLQSEKSLGGEIRFRMLVVVRDFALQIRLTSNAAESISRSHADYFVDFAKTAAPHFFSSRSAEWVERFDLEFDNVRSAIKWALDHDPQMAARLIATTRHLVGLRAQTTEARYWFEEVLKRQDELPLELCCEMLTGFGVICQYQLDYATALAAHEQCLKVCRGLRDVKLTARSLRGLGAIAHMERNSETARKWIDEALDLSRSIGDEFGEAAALARLGDIANFDRDYESAKALLTKSLELFRKMDYKMGISSKLSSLCITEFYLGNFESTREYLIEALNTCIEIGDHIDFRINFDVAAALMVETADYRAAALLSGATAAQSEELAHFHEPVEQGFRDAYVRKLKDAMRENDFESAFSEGRKMSVIEATKLALDTPTTFRERAVSLRLVKRRSAR
jgi:predicted ATPase/DNA-binding winged helix-turn-helix (wHTH) protein